MPSTNAGLEPRQAGLRGESGVELRRRECPGGEVGIRVLMHPATVADSGFPQERDPDGTFLGEPLEAPLFPNEKNGQ